MKRCRTQAFGSRPIVHQFWQDMNYDINDSTKLPALAKLSTKSYLLQDHPVKIWTYHKKITNLPMVKGKQVEICDAREIIPEKEYRLYGVHCNKQIHDRPHIAQFVDLFRVEVVLKHGDWWSDIDMICLRPLPQPRKRGDIILSAAPNKLNSIRSWHHSDINGGQFTNTIFYAPAGHSFLEKVTKRYRDLRFSKMEFSHFIVLMHDMFIVAKENGYINTVKHPKYFVPHPWWKNKPTIIPNAPQVTVKHFGYEIPSVEQIKNHSYTFNYYKGMLRNLESGNLPETCALVQITKHIEKLLDEKFVIEYWNVDQ